ncbi:bidirectional sugar transporter SWEET3b-like isoform X2 [Macadamia integrifolia]|uniref:bidirectional sugar transporter SWEET3b-like isoform X2 n=1 Tax=Macadamia integrifolia TaxID=60698 RepID=UPI001C52DCDD|nr:bidirectional sugar transporter SWEET3b-like isoform X2 [Macadamia integrifolia]
MSRRMEDQIHLALGIAGNVTSVLLYSAPILTFKRIIQKRSTEEFSGVIFESAYVLIYIWFASANRKRILAILMVVAVIMVVSITTLVSTFALHDHHHRKLFVGSIGIVFTVGMYASPLVVVKRVIQTKSVEFMPFYLSLFSFLNTLLWGLYGLLAHDPFIGLPSVLGCPLSFLQLMLYYIYRNREIREKNDTDLENNGRKNEFQLP